MSTDRDLDSRLRAVLTSAADTVDPLVGDLLTEATARGRRRRSRRHGAVLAAALAVVAVPVSIVGLSRRDGNTEVGPAAPSPAGLIGTWQTASLPAADWAATYRRAGGSDAAANAFVGPPMDGPAAEFRIVLRVTAAEWAVFVSADNRELEPGWRGAYRLDGSLIHAQATDGRCGATYQVALADQALRVKVLDDDCGDTDDLAQQTIFQTAEFRKSG